MEMMGQSSNSSNLKSHIVQTYVSKSLEGFKDEDPTYELLLVTRFANMKKLTTPALTIGLNITNSMAINPPPPSVPHLILPQYDEPLSKQLTDAKNLQSREFPSSSIDLREGDISESRSFSGMSETNAVIKLHNYSKMSENNNYSRFDSNKPKGIVVGVKRKPYDEKPESSKITDCQKLTYESGWDRTDNDYKAFVRKKRINPVYD
ncbi:uncharacterized protein LOC100118612 isoform X5 [Nasonia vitripennis]|uniref:Uncharacterized protein n=1 Tax=Nasonia vitripennis TaxID=7425 RepID=A0A7M7QSM6_NASVI|nr:uncharacterized protein LOC100118612 isoform X5 [Nasonia vitripennis]